MAISENEALSDLRRLTECCICLMTFTDPRMLPCIHSACLKCFEDIQKKNKKIPGDVIPCPVCRKEFTIPPTGMSGLQNNFVLANLMEITQKFNEEGTYQRGKNCPKHPLQVLNYYCGDCKTVVCVSCFVEKHKSHDCKDVTTVDKELRKSLETNSSDISHYISQMVGRRSDMEKKKTNLLEKTSKIENAIRLKNQQLKALIDEQTQLILHELSSLKQKLFKDIEAEVEEIERKMTILQSFQTYCPEIKSKGSPTDVYSCVEGLMRRANELKKENDEYLNGPVSIVEVKFNATYEDVLSRSCNNVIGNIEESTKKVKSYAVVIGGQDYGSVFKDVIKINLHKTGDISNLQLMPTQMMNECAATFFCNSIYITGIGSNKDEIWKFDATPDNWKKCASLVKGRRRHSVAFVDQFLYICGGFVWSEKSVLDDVEVYDAINDRCSFVGKLVHCVQNSDNCVPFNSSLYIFGGKDVNNIATSYVQVYDTKSNTCTLLSHQMPIAYSHMRTVLVEETVILLGKHACFLYNLETGTWQQRPQFKTEVVNFGLVLDKGQIFVIGGAVYTKSAGGNVKWTYRNDVRCIPVKKILENKIIEWRHHAILPRKMAVFACAKCEFEDD